MVLRRLSCTVKAFLEFEDKSRSPAEKALSGLKTAAGTAQGGSGPAKGSMLTTLRMKADSAEADVGVLQVGGTWGYRREGQRGGHALDGSTSA